jgi:formylmethanofuran dehydrogenase subunit E
MFRIKRMKITVPEYAPIFASVRCSICGEKVMEARARLKEGKAVCMDCAGGEHYVLDGRGISTKGT